MLLEHLKDLLEYGLVSKETYTGYPLKVEYFLTESRGTRILEALSIMQEIGIDFMIENNMIDVLKEKRIID